MHAAGTRFVGRVAADEGARIAGVALLRGAAGGWVFNCAEGQVLRDRKDAAAVRGATAVLVLTELGGLVDCASPRILGYDAP